MTIHRTSTSIASAVKQANRALDELTNPGHRTRYFEGIPLDALLNAVKNGGFRANDNDAANVYSEIMRAMRTPKKTTERAVIGLETPYRDTKRQYALTFTYYRMPSGRWEIVAYVS